MRLLSRIASLRSLALLGGVVLLASCGEHPKPAPPPPPPPPKQVVIPPRPTPPNGAASNIVVPQLTSDGLYKSVNRNISPAQMVWNLRSAYNVGALNCLDARHVSILAGYKQFLKTQAKTLKAANLQVDKEFKGKYGSGYIVNREKYMTEVYNHYALPPTLSDFCDAVLAISNDAQTVKPADLQAFAVRSLPNVEIVFDVFYRRYEKYQQDLRDWNSHYGTYAMSGPDVGIKVP